MQTLLHKNVGVGKTVEINFIYYLISIKEHWFDFLNI